ncbi:hypothetical protein GL2_22540 [Microbulbifer sp. GL-2]|nr:hypothetical protein GL2_22540 [Microbulbifer sp. GL-2]
MEQARDFRDRGAFGEIRQMHGDRPDLLPRKSGKLELCAAYTAVKLQAVPDPVSLHVGELLQGKIRHFRVLI